MIFKKTKITHNDPCVSHFTQLGVCFNDFSPVFEIMCRFHFYWNFLTGFIKFFGNVAQTRPQEIFTEYQTVINLVFELYAATDPILSNLALETIGFVASTPDGKLALNQHGSSKNFCFTLFQFLQTVFTTYTTRSKNSEKFCLFLDIRMRSVVQHLGKIVTLQASERKVVALNVFTNIIQLNVSTIYLLACILLRITWSLNFSFKLNSCTFFFPSKDPQSDTWTSDHYEKMVLAVVWESH